MRYRLTSGLATRLAAAMAVLCAIPSQVRAWDEERVSSELQPYFGVWVGSYMVNTADLYTAVYDDEKKILGNDFFMGVLPAGGLSFGVAYSRLHIGINGGYQLVDGNSSGREAQMKAAGMYTKYQYQVIPVDIGVDVALLRNEMPVNLLVGGSVGVGFIGVRQPYQTLRIEYEENKKRVVEDRFYYNEWNYTNALLATLYLGARINLGRRLNLEGQLGWRSLTSDEMELGNNAYTAREATYRPNDTTYTLEPIPLNLSGAYFRVDLRWTFASQVEREADQRTVMRVREVRDAMALAALRPYRVSAR